MRTKLLTCTVAAILALSACGGDDADGDDAQAGGDSPVESAGAELAASALVQTGQTDVGEVLTDAEGRTLYGFTNDSGGTPTCADDCADAWPALTVEGGELPEGLDPAVFSVAQRPDGTSQLMAGDWPLYTFSGDSAPGDVNGQGQGGVWYAVGPDGQLKQDATATTDADAGTETGDGGAPSTTAPAAPPTTETSDPYDY